MYIGKSWPHLTMRGFTVNKEVSALQLTSSNQRKGIGKNEALYACYPQEYGPLTKLPIAFLRSELMKIDPEPEIVFDELRQTMPSKEIKTQ